MVARLLGRAERNYILKVMARPDDVEYIWTALLIFMAPEAILTGLLYR